jgi:hypothetical protein
MRVNDSLYYPTRYRTLILGQLGEYVRLGFPSTFMFHIIVQVCL